MASTMQLTVTSVALLLCLISYPHLTSAQNYGDACNSTTVCDNSAGLTCDLDGLTCSCIAPAFMVYNVDLEKCVSLADNEGICYVEPIGGVERPCVPNAECIRRTGPGIPDDSPFGYCACASGFVKYSDRTCDRPKMIAYGESCNTTHTCNHESSIVCDNAAADPVCACADPSFMIYNPKESECQTLIGQEGNCYRKPIGGIIRKCVDNAECLPRPEDETSPFGYCACVSGFIGADDRTCIFVLPEYGEACNATNPCNPASSLGCDLDAEICTCMDKDAMVYDADSKICRTLTGGPADSCYMAPIDGVFKKCVINAYCRPGTGDLMKGTCMCNANYVPLADKTCDTPKYTEKYGTYCNASQSCDWRDGLSCSGNPGVCGCMDPTDMVYDAQSNSCRSLTNGDDGSCFMAPLGGVEKKCVPNSYCRPNEEGNPLYGTCRCEESYVSLADRSCGLPILDMKHGSICNTTHLCDSMGALSCAGAGIGGEGICACMDTTDMVYDVNSDTCRTLTNGQDGSCYMAPIGGVRKDCVSNSYCEPDMTGDPMYGKCICNDEYVALADRSCAMPQFNEEYSAPCNSSHLCVKEKILTCNAQGAARQCGCQAGTGMFYETTTDACVVPAGLEYSCSLVPVDGILRRCTRNAGCLARPEGSVADGYCACVDGFGVNADNTCRLKTFEQGYGQNCNTTMGCRPNALLACDTLSEVCTCSYPGDLYDGWRGKCLSPLKGICYDEPVGGEIRDCPENAECVPIQAGLPYGSCECGEGFMPGAGGKCIPGVQTSTVTTTKSTTPEVTTPDATTTPEEITTSSATTITSAVLPILWVLWMLLHFM